jgi:hypothetical protein
VTDRPGWAVLAYPAPLYAAALVLVALHGAGPGLFLGFAAVLGFGAVVGFGILRHPVWILLGTGLVAIAILLPLALRTTSAVGLGFASGAVVALPLLAIGVVWRESAPAAARVVGLEAILALGLWWIAAVGDLSSESGPAGLAFLRALWSVATGQADGLGALLRGGSPTSMPLATAFDPIYMGLGILAIGGLLLSWVVPRTALGEPLPWSWARPAAEPPTSGAPDDLDRLGLRPGQLEALATRTPPTPPRTEVTPGFRSLVAAALAALAFVGLAATSAPSAPLALAVGAAVAVGAVIYVLARRLTPRAATVG